MELKRILAKDMRTAQEKATALYGPDVLVISSCQVRGQTEMIVAVDVAPLEAEEALQEDFPHAVVSQPSSGQSQFSKTLLQVMPNRRTAMTETARGQEIAGFSTTNTTSPTGSVEEASASATGQQAHDQIRGQEIVSLVREELSALRKEFRLNQQMAMWSSGQSLPPSLLPLQKALQDAPIPGALRALLLEVLPDHESADAALAAIRHQLEHVLAPRQSSFEGEGIHVVAGPSGSGKTLMLARLAQSMALKHGAEQVAVVSYCDLRPGAWNQTQLLSTQSGVECYRATSVGALKLLLDDLSHRRVLLIDTAGVQTPERVQEIRGICPTAQFHAVVPADASVATLRRLFVATDGAWHSIMVSKLDESTQPWPLIQFLTESPVGWVACSKGDKMGDWMPVGGSSELVDAALSGLGVVLTPGAFVDGLDHVDTSRAAITPVTF